MNVLIYLVPMALGLGLAGLFAFLAALLPAKAKGAGFPVEGPSIPVEVPIPEPVPVVPVPEPTPVMIESNGAFSNSAFSPSFAATAVKTSTSIPMTVLPSVSMNSFGA